MDAGYQLAKQFEHSTLIGDVREYFVKMFLSNILPETMGVGGGEIMDISGKKSNEIDTIIYSKNFPILKLSNSKSIFPIEAVIATIEVKSSLKGDKLNEALENCKSVTDLNPLVFQNPTVMQQMTAGGVEVEWAFPSTYIFGYTHYATRASELTSAVEKWKDSYNSRLDQVSPALLSFPTMLVTEGCLALRKSHRLDLEAAENRPVVFAAARTDFKIHVFVCDLLDTIMRRTSLSHPSMPSGVFAMREYFNTAKLIQEKIGSMIEWDYIYL